MKIKKVIIEGFRAYKSKSDGTFDFLTEDGECANLVAIYAPNGFGKTSFYDAVEWALTNNISRYLIGSQKNNNNKTSIGLNVSGEYQFILRNNQIGLESPSRVIVQTEDLHYINWVPKINKGGRDYKFDPSQTFEGTEELVDMFLSQDAIDNFIKEIRAEDRYTKFMRHFDSAEEEYRANLLTASNANKNRVKQLTEDLKILDQELSKPINPKILEIINEGISELIKKGAKLSFITMKFGTAERAELKTTLKKYTIATQHRVNELSETILEAQTLVDSENSYYIYRAEKEKILQSFPELTALIANVTQRDKVVNNRVRYNNSLQILNKEQRQDDTIAALLPRYAIALKNIKQCESAQLSTNKEIVSLETTLAENSTITNDSQKELLAIDRRLLDVSIQGDGSQKKYASIAENKKTIELLLLDADLYHHSLSKLNNEEKSLANQLVRLELTVTQPTPELIEHAKLLGVDAKLILLLERSLEHKTQSEASLISANSKLTQFQEYQSEISKLVQLGQNIIQHSKQSFCPLCKTPLGTFEILSKKILSSSPLTTEQNIISVEISQLHESLNRLKIDIDLQSKRIIESINLDIAKLKAQLKEKQVAAKEISNSIASCNADISKLKALTSELEIQLFNLTPVEFEARTISEREDLQTRRDTLQTLIQAAQSKAFELTDQISTIKSKYKSIETTIQTLQADPIYTQVELCSQELKMRPDELSAFFETRTESRNKLRSELEEKINQTSDTLSKIDKLEEFNSEDQLSLTVKMSDLKNQLSTLEAALSPYNNIFAKLSLPAQDSSPPQTTIANIKSQTTDLIKRQETYISNLESYEVLSSQIEELEPFFKNQETLKSAVELRERIEHHTRIQSMVDDDYAEVIKHLHERIGRFFSQNLINEIYGRIDPHPEFKAIEFKCDFTGDSGPRLEILIRDKSNKLSAPNFHFSTAQLNILSLSIFLAKAINRKNSSYPIDAILIDDPIHSMDSINILSIIDTLRNISKTLNKQIIISTHDENFFKLLKKKIPERIYNSKFIQLETYGKVAR